MQKQVKFDNESGHTLVGVMHLPDAGPVRAFALFAHCFTCTKNLKASVHVAEALTASGIAVLRFDFTGLGQSEGEFTDTHFSSNVQDLLDASGWLAENHAPPQILVGHSLGGTAVLAAARHIESALAVATIGAPAEADHILHLLDDDLETIEQSGEAHVQLDGRSFTIRRDFVEDVRSQSVRDGIGDLRKALLVMHSPLDEVVPIDEASRIFSSAMHPKSFVTLDDADHLLSSEHDSRYAGRVLAAWAERYLDDGQPQPPAVSTTTDATSVAARTGDMFLTAVNANGHRLVADEPESHGGSDRGPTPYDLLAAALGTCTAMTINMYARHKELPLEQVDVTVRHERIHAKDCEDCETSEGQVGVLRRKIRLHGELDDGQRERLLQIADRCPVHRTLEGEIRIRSELA